MNPTDIENVKVVVRCRPLTEREKIEKFNEVLELNEDNGSITIKSNNDIKTFTFDKIFGPSSEQEVIYNMVASPLVESVIEGYNGTILAYGQTGTGKTYTMEGYNSNFGIIPNSFSHIFDYIYNSGVNKNFLVRVSYLEIYNEEVRDLLNKDDKKLEVVERPEIGVYVKNLLSFPVNSAEEMRKLMNLGNKIRAVGATNMNEHSSRSHAIFTVTIECSNSSNLLPNVNNTNPEISLDSQLIASSNHVRMGKLHLVDLAGSERLAKSKAHLFGGNQRLKEASKINFSLSCLGNVVSALSGASIQHVPYRNSKLTHILKDSLGGNAKTVMIANIGPADYNYEETLSTLRYANRVKSIKNKAVINEDPKDAMLRKYQKDIEELKRMLENTNEDDLPSDEDDDGGEEESNINKDKVSTPGSCKRKTLSQTKIQDIQNEIDMEKKLLSDRKDLLDEEKNIVLIKLQQREKQLIDARLERDALILKLSSMEHNVLMGGGSSPKPNSFSNSIISSNTFPNPDMNMQALRDSSQELADRVERTRALTRAFKETQALGLDMEEKYVNLKEEALGKTEKLQKVWEALLEAKSKIKEIGREHQMAKDSALDTLRSLNRECKLYTSLVDYFVVRPAFLNLIKANSEWDEIAQEWRLQCVAYTGNNVLNSSAFTNEGSSSESVT
ncbi:unnamed protein product [Gordionus sp. m RMFG-2023]